MLSAPDRANEGDHWHPWSRGRLSMSSPGIDSFFPTPQPSHGCPDIAVAAAAHLRWRCGTPPRPPYTGRLSGPRPALCAADARRPAATIRIRHTAWGRRVSACLEDGPTIEVAAGRD